MDLIDARDSPELVVSGEAHAQQRRARVEAPPVAVCMDRKLAVTAKIGDPGKSDAVQAHHHARAAAVQYEVVAAAHPVQLSSDVEGVHHLLARTAGVLVNDAHHRVHTLAERAMGAVALQLVILDEIDTRLGQFFHQLRGFFR